MSLNSSRMFPPVVRVIAAALLVLALLAPGAAAQTLIGSPFITGFEGWQSTYTTLPLQVGGPPSWSVLLTPDPVSGQRFLMENGDGRAGDGTTTAAVADGQYKPYILINSLDTTPADYSVSYQLATVDNDGFGVVFGYQNQDNYFRVGFRQQAGGNLGFQEGTSVQKVVGGTITQIANTLAGFVPNSGGTPFEAKVVVTGANWDIQVASTVGGAFVSVLSGNDAALQPGKYGVHSWAQREVSTTLSPQYGTIVGPITVASATLNKTTNFANAVSAVPWRRLVMVNSFGETGFEQPPGTGNAADDYGNFGQDFVNGVIRDDSNGNINATAGAANIDFMGPAIVVDAAGANAMTDYRYAVRVENRDNDGIGLLFRVADDSNFYRINWATEGPGAGTTRPPQGMSIQKYTNATWTEVFRETTPIFLPADSVPFDVSIQAVGNQFKIDVLADPNGVPQAHSYGVITDGSADPILAGSVGLTNWGNGDGNNGAVYSAYNGNATSLVTALSALIDLDLVVDRTSGNVSLINSSSTFAAIKGISILSDGGTINSANWLSVTDNYDKAPQNGSVDPNHNWTELTITDFNLSERDNTTNGGSLSGSQSVNLGNFWRKSQIEDLVLSIELANGNFVVGEVSYINGPGGVPYSRSDLNVDGSVNATDWGLFFPNMLTNIGAMTGYQRALLGDLDLDGDNDVGDFALFKTDYDAVNGSGAFNALLAGVPEPSTALLVLVAALSLCASRSRRHVRFIAIGWGIASLLALGSPARAVPLDFTTFGTENFPKAQFNTGVWVTDATTASLNSNADATVLYSPANIFNQRITGTLTAGTDDDVVGFVLGFEPGDSAIGSSADYFLIDWKGATQSFDFTDDVGVGNNFHNLTGADNMPAGLALSRVTGSANADELWQHQDLAASPTGGVTQLARAATRGSSSYSTTGSHQFDITYTSNQINVKVGGVEQFNLFGSFTAGRFGLYSAWQGPTATFSNFEVLDVTGLTATVDRGTGTITLNNPFSTAVDFDYYQLSSASNSLDQVDWNSLHDQNFQPAGAGDHQKWQEAGGSSASTIGEVFLDGNSTLAASASQAIGAAYDNVINGEDLVFRYRLVTGEVGTGFVQYIGAPPGVPGDYNGNGAVDAADYIVWRKGGALQHEVATIGSNTPEDYTEWRARFGNPPGSGSSLGEAQGVPEPATIGLLLCMGLALASHRAARRGR